VWRGFCRLAAFAGWMSAAVVQAEPSSQFSSPCEQAGQEAERQYSLPVGLLGAIGRIESGHWDAGLRRVVPSPWAIDAGGQPHLKDSKAEAVQEVQALQSKGIHNIDIGCFQINLQQHPNAFADLDQAFDPAANAQYAARFLSSLHSRLENWRDAVAAYHSVTPALGNPYSQMVFANWSAGGSTQPSPPTIPVITVKVFSVDGGDVRVWSPGTTTRTPSAINLAGEAIAGLPNIITP